MKWKALHKQFGSDPQALVELTAMAWRQAAGSNRREFAEFMSIGKWSTEMICTYLDTWNVEPDVDTLMWVRLRA